MGQAIQRVIKEFHFTSLADFGVPQDLSVLISVMREGNNWKGLSQCTMVCIVAKFWLYYEVDLIELINF